MQRLALSLVRFKRSDIKCKSALPAQKLGCGRKLATQKVRVKHGTLRENFRLVLSLVERASGKRQYSCLAPAAEANWKHPTTNRMPENTPPSASPPPQTPFIARLSGLLRPGRHWLRPLAIFVLALAFGIAASVIWMRSRTSQPAPTVSDAAIPLDPQHSPLPAPMGGDLSKFPSDIPTSANAAYIKPTPAPKPVENATSYSPSEAVVPDATQMQQPLAGLPVSDVAPQVIKRTQPNYPIDAMRAHAEGEVQLKITIDGFGRVSDVQVSRSSHSRSLDRAALDAARNWQFRPAIHNGQHVPSTMTESVEFRLDD